jgi:hypothetical protein
VAILEDTGIVAAGKEARKKAVQVSKQSKTAGGKGVLQNYKENFMKQIDAGGGVDNATEAEQKRYRQYQKDLQKPKQNIFGEIFKFSKTPERQNFFSPGGTEVAKVASSDLSNLNVGSEDTTFGKSFTKQADANLAQAETAQPLSPIGSDLYKKEVDQFVDDFKKDFNYRKRFDVDTGIEKDPRTFKPIPGGEKFGEEEMRRDYPYRRDFRYEFNPLKYVPGEPYGKKEEDVKVAQLSDKQEKKELADLLSLPFLTEKQKNDIINKTSGAVPLSDAGVKKEAEEKKGFGERIANLAGSVFNTVTGTQSAEASQIPGGMPDTTTSGDTSFAAYRMGGGVQQEQKGIVKPSKTVTIDGQKVAAKQTVASLPSNYKATEKEAFRKAAAFKEAKKIAKRNPNVSVSVDSKGQPKATATNDTGRAKAQAAAVNRKLSGRSISSVKAANKQAMRDKAAARHATFKKTKKSTVGQRRAAAKKAMQAKAKKRHAAFKKRRAAKKKKKCDIFLKYNISPLTNMNLIRDDLAEVAYFVKEIQS